MDRQYASDNHSDLQQLQQAFEQFNRLSQQLSDSVDEINQNVERFDDIEMPVKNPHEALFDAIPGAVVVLDRQGNVTQANELARSILGAPLFQVPWRDVIQRVFQPELDQGELKTHDNRQYSIATRPLGYAPGQVLLLS
ncbi:MAG: PAS domain-containing protein, partial [Pseudomonadota bacterium]